MNDLELDLELEPRRTAVVTIDLQKGIVAMAGNPQERLALLGNSARLLSASRSAGAQAVLVHVGFSPDGRDRLHPAADRIMSTSSTPPPDWMEFVPELNHQAGDIAIIKRQWGAFYGTDLDLQLRRRGLTTIVLCGIATEIGVESTARAAYEHGYELVFATDAMIGSNMESHVNSIRNIFPRMGRVRSTERIVAALQA